MLNMRVSSRRALAALAVLLALSSPHVDAVANCAECTGGKTCLLEDKSLALGAGQSSLQLKFCNFDVAKKSDYKLSFQLKKPLACDPNFTLKPEVAALTPQDGCAPANCVVTAALKSAIDWAILIKNDNEVSVLQAKLEGSDELVQVAQGTADIGAAAITGAGTGATVCSTSFSVKAARLSKLGVCNKVTLCRGKPADTACTTPVPSVSNAMVDDVTCAADACTGTISLDGGLPCEAASGDGTAVLVAIKVANGANSPYASIATLSPARAATITSASGVAVGSTQVTIMSDATCASKSLNVTVDGLALNGIAPANGTILVSLAKALTSTQAGSNLDISVSQCGVASKDFTAKVGEMGSDAEMPSKTNANTTSSSSASPSGARTSQEENAGTGLPNGLYIGIGVGTLAFVGFCFECWYHRRRHRQEHGSGNGGGGSGGNAATAPV